MRIIAITSPKVVGEDVRPYLKALNFGGEAMMETLYHMDVLKKLKDIDAYR